jgi:hypothetical protein
MHVGCAAPRIFSLAAGRNFFRIDLAELLNVSDLVHLEFAAYGEEIILRQ